MAADLTSGAQSRYQADRSWLDVERRRTDPQGSACSSTVRTTGPRTTGTRARTCTALLPPYKSTRNEGFGKLTFTPTRSVLINGSYRDSKRVDTSSADFASNAAASTGSGCETRQKIGIVEGSWVINNRSYATGKFTDFTLLTHGRPDNVANVTINTTPGTRWISRNLDKLGLLTVRCRSPGRPRTTTSSSRSSTATATRSTDVPTGGGTTGYSSTLFDNDDFFRKAGQVGYNLTLGSTMRHTIHAGYQRYVDSEDLERGSNGWGR